MEQISLPQRSCSVDL